MHFDVLSFSTWKHLKNERKSMADIVTFWKRYGKKAHETHHLHNWDSPTICRRFMWNFLTYSLSCNMSLLLHPQDSKVFDSQKKQRKSTPLSKCEWWSYRYFSRLKFRPDRSIPNIPKLSACDGILSSQGQTLLSRDLTEANGWKQHTQTVGQIHAVCPIAGW